MNTPSIIDLLATASKRVALDIPKDTSTEISRFPIVVSKETRDFLEAQASVMGGSLAGLCGAILNEVVAETKRRAELDTK